MSENELPKSINNYLLVDEMKHPNTKHIGFDLLTSIVFVSL